MSHFFINEKYLIQKLTTTILKCFLILYVNFPTKVFLRYFTLKIKRNKIQNHSYFFLFKKFSLFFFISFLPNKTQIHPFIKKNPNEQKPP